VKKRMICVLAVLCLFCGTASAQSISAHSAIVIDADTHTVYYEKNADERRLIASTTKIMTALVALDTLAPDRIVTVPAEAVRVGGSSMYLREGEEVSVEALLYGEMLVSGNDAAYTLAAAGGDLDAFVAAMNEKAQEFGLVDTSFANPHGLDDDDNYSTARNMAILASNALKNPVFREICASKNMQIEGRQLKNHNKLLSMYEGTVGVKTGFTKAAGRCLVSAVERDGRTLICVTLNAPDDWNDHMQLYDAVFAGLQKTSICEKDVCAVQIPTAYGGFVEARFAQDAAVSLFDGEAAQLAWEIEAPRFFYRLPNYGAVVGQAALMFGEYKLMEMDLICG